jgi:hypothetical protein
MLQRSDVRSGDPVEPAVRTTGDSCGDDVCGPPLPSCAQRAISFEVDRRADQVPGVPATTAVTCHTRDVTTLAGWIPPEELGPEFANLPEEDEIYCVDTLRFLPSFDGQSWWQTEAPGAPAVGASAFADGCDGVLCGTMVFPSGERRERSCSLAAVCDGGHNGYGYGSAFVGHAVVGD